ncbi:MAG TPA: translation initiation factor IF-3 [Candidatus Aerophobetes bacterium]|uniref:Translation initiation factor IF-3 n=1 Tax=Aerophobetes bacterium TaxID=2030807 RepID=A0A7V0QQH1_UNCAE|nr:translation initiation factor IF-3 [Candidatus Aerophobetes bacterium]
MAVNEEIRARKVRLIDAQGRQMGIFSREQALEIARKEELDLVEVAPQANPPVCRLLDYGKFKYQLDKKRRKNRKKQTSDTLKEIRLSYKIGDHDLQIKVKKVQQFLKEGHRVKLSIRFRGRENIYKEEGKQLLEKVAKEVEDVGKVESRPSVGDRKIEQYLVPK